MIFLISELDIASQFPKEADSATDMNMNEIIRDFPGDYLSPV